VIASEIRLANEWKVLLAFRNPTGPTSTCGFVTISIHEYYKRLEPIFGLPFSEDSLQLITLPRLVYRQPTFLSFPPKYPPIMSQKQSRQALKAKAFLEEPGGIQEEIGGPQEEAEDTQEETGDTQEETEGTQEETESTQEEAGDSLPPITPSNQLQRNPATLSFEELRQPKEVRIGFTTCSNSKEIYFDDISSMTIELPTLDDKRQDDVHIRALEFLGKLLGNRFKSLEFLELSGFRVNRLLWERLCKLSQVSLRLTCPLLDPFEFRLDAVPGFTHLYLKLDKTCDLNHFPYLPSSLVNLSLRFSNLKGNDKIVNISHCSKLKRL
jgi:hypothetical protein